MLQKIYLSLACMDGKEQDFIKKVSDTNWVVPLCPNVNDFEKDLSNYIEQNRYVVALSAGTTAVHLGLLSLGVGVEDEIICQSFTFAVSANPATYLGATPIFVDSKPDTWNISPQLLEKTIVECRVMTGKCPKAITFGSS